MLLSFAMVTASRRFLNKMEKYWKGKRKLTQTYSAKKKDYQWS